MVLEEACLFTETVLQAESPSISVKVVIIVMAFSFIEIAAMLVVIQRTDAIRVSIKGNREKLEYFKPNNIYIL